MKKLIVLLALSFFHSSAIYAESTLVVDQDYLPTLLKELDKSETSVDVLAFSFAIDDGQGNIQSTNAAFQVAEKLVNLKKEKGHSIAIRLYIEGERSTFDRNKITSDYLEKAGIQVKFGSTHAKGFSIDHKTILFGSTNLTTQSMMRNNETNILSDDSLIVKGFDFFFDNLYKGGSIGSVALEKPMLADGVYKAFILNAIKTATKSLEFSIYYFNDADIENELIKASKRGVVITGYFNSKIIPGSNLVEKNREAVERMKKNGITELYFASDKAFTHSKYIICDKEKIILGTGNWNYSDVNSYRQLYVELNDAQLAVSLASHLSDQIKSESSLFQ